MRVLVGHNYYQLPGGEDNVFVAETAMLEGNGHRVIRYTRHNDELNGMGTARAGAATLWNQATFRELKEVALSEKPDVCHFHNTFPMMSPSVFYAAKSLGIPVVLTLHNYRLICPSAVLMREDRICEDCVGRAIPAPGVIHSCYRGSRAASAGVSAMLGLHRAMGTWQREVDLYIALTEFARRKFIQGGLPAEKIAVKPNFVDPDPGYSDKRSSYALFVGRLSREKGLKTMLEAWRSIGETVPLRIAGDGPMAVELREGSELPAGVTWLGPLGHDEVLMEMKGARMLIFPSIWYEGLPLTVLEAFATGLPVIASDLGSIPELVEHGRTGLRFTPGDAADLASKVLWAASHEAEMQHMSGEARREFENKYTRDRNCDLLLECYSSAIRAVASEGEVQRDLADSSV